MEIRRFGPGHRRPEGPSGSTGLSGQVIHQDARAIVSELAFSAHGMIAPHTNPDTTLFIVVSGGGFVQVGDERSRVTHGEAVVWPAEVPHGAYTDGTEMRAIVVELSGADDAWARGILEAGEGSPAAERRLPGGPGQAGAGAPAENGGQVDQGQGSGPATERGQPPAPTPAQGSLAGPESSSPSYDPSTGEPW